MRFYKGLFDHVLHLLQDSGQFFIYMGGDREHWTVNFEYPSLFVKFLCLIPDKNLSVKETLLFFFHQKFQQKLDKMIHWAVAKSC